MNGRTSSRVIYHTSNSNEVKVRVVPRIYTIKMRKNEKNERTIQRLFYINSRKASSGVQDKY